MFGYTGSGAEITNVGLLNIDIIGASNVGGLVGWNRGTIMNSYATGSVSGNSDVGGLVGDNRNATIMNSYATGSVLGNSDVGGLVGWNKGTIMNSYATGSVLGNSDVGGLVGWNRGTIMNSYATGSVSGNSDVGGLVGDNRNATIMNSYWDVNTSGIQTSAGGTSKTSVELKAANAPNEDSDKPYHGWSITNWDFGTSSQYPILKYTDNPNTDSSECRTTSASDTTTDLPVCGSLLSPALRYGLSELQLVKGDLSPAFDVVVPNYRGTVVSSASTIRFRPITVNPDAEVYITVNEEARGIAMRSGDESGMISLNTDGITTITIEVENGGETTPTVIYTLFLNYYEFSGDVDRDDDGLIEIDNLESLNAMRYQPDGTGYRESETAPKVTAGCPNNGCIGYELTRDLYFNGAGSSGWQPIGVSLFNAFTGKFEGNGFTISNIRIDRGDTSQIGLFGYTGSGAEITNVGLLNVNITGTSNVGSLVGWNRGTIMNSYSTGDVSGDVRVGGLVGDNQDGTITNSYSTGDVSGDVRVGGLVGDNQDGAITNSYATGGVSGNNILGGLVGDNQEGTIINSYATGDVSGDGSNVGGLVGDNQDGTITSSYATGGVSGNNILGGLVGDNQEGRIINSYATGNVLSNGQEAGGLVGDNQDGTITKSYWDVNTSGIHTSAGGTSKTSVELKAERAQDTDPDKSYHEWSTTNWDFGTSSQYPILKSADSNTLLSGQGVGLRDLEVLTPGARLIPIFGVTTTHYVISFLATRTRGIILRLKAHNTDATIKVVRQGEDKNYFEDGGSDGQSELIPIDTNTALVITVTEADAETAITTTYTISPRMEANTATDNGKLSDSEAVSMRVPTAIRIHVRVFLEGLLRQHEN